MPLLCRFVAFSWEKDQATYSLAHSCTSHFLCWLGSLGNGNMPQGKLCDVSLGGRIMGPQLVF